MSLYSWGENKHQELGLGPDYQQYRLSAEPILVKPLEDADIVKVACGNGHTLVLNKNGEIFAFGRGREGQLGIGTSVAKLAHPVRIKDNGLADEIVVKICAGDGASAAITRHGELYEWGFIHAPTEGDASNPSNALPGLARETRGMSDRLKELLRESTIQYLQGDGAHTTDHGMDQDRLDAEAGILVVRTRRQMRYAPVRSPFKFKVRDIALGYGHSLIVTEIDGHAWTKGYNDRGQLGVGTRINEVDFIQVLGPLKNRAISSIACGNSHNLAVCANSGECYAWGSNVLGQLGISEAHADQLLPMRVKIDEPVKQVSAGSYHSVALSVAKNLYSFGHAEYGQHGMQGGESGDYGRHLSRHYFIPQIVKQFSATGTLLKEVQCGQLSTCALDEAGGMWTWGFGAAGNLGQGIKQLDNRAGLVEGMIGQVIVQFSAGHQHVICLTKPEGHPFALKNQTSLIAARLGEDALFDCVIFGKAAEPVKVHKPIILARCPRLTRYFVTSTECALPNGVEQKVVLALVEYLYTDVVRACPPHRLVDLQELASARYLNLPRLESLCALQRYQRRVLDNLHGANKQNKITRVDQVPESSFAMDMLALLRSEDGADVRIAGADASEHKTQSKDDDSIPNGHTHFSWFGVLRGSSPNALPPGHTTFTFGSNRTVFRVHSYLFSRYPFFQVLLGGHFREQVLVRSGKVLRLDTVPSPEALRQLLEWIYSGTIHGGISGENVADVLRMALAFGVEDLARHCELFLLLNGLDRDNVEDVLHISEETGLTKLATECRRLLGQ